MNANEWAADQLEIPTVMAILRRMVYRDMLNGIVDALGITRYRAAYLVQTAIKSEGYRYE